MRLNGLVVERKATTANLVTSADRDAEHFVMRALRQHRLLDGLISEEGTALSSSSGRHWVIDPIDGTFNFVAGLSSWCTAVALIEGDRVVVSAVRRQALDETWVMARGQTELNGAAVTPLREMPLKECSFASYLDAVDLHDQSFMASLTRVASSAATVRVSGSGTCDLADVAAGRIGLWMQADCADWDWLPGKALVDGAGGTTTIVEQGDRRRWHLAGSYRAVTEASALLHRD